MEGIYKLLIKFSYFPNFVIYINHRQIINYLNKDALLWPVRLVELCELEIAHGPQGPEGDKVAPWTPGAKGDPATPGTNPSDDPELQYEECIKYWSHSWT